MSEGLDGSTLPSLLSAAYFSLGQVPLRVCGSLQQIPHSSGVSNIQGSLTQSRLHFHSFMPWLPRVSHLLALPKGEVGKPGGRKSKHIFPSLCSGAVLQLPVSVRTSVARIIRPLELLEVVYNNTSKPWRFCLYSIMFYKNTF